MKGTVMRQWNRVVLSVAVLVGCSMAPAVAQRSWMQEPEILKELTNLRLTGLYPTNVAWSEQINPDGTTDYQEGQERRPGQWTVQGELYCFSYVLPHQGGCFRIVKHSLNCYELYTVSIGNASMRTPPPADAMAWNGRMWREAEPGTCGEKSIS